MSPIPALAGARNGTVAILVAAMLVLPCGSHATDKLRVGRANATAFSFTPLDVGIETGVFARRGIDVESVAFTGDAKLQQALGADAIDIGVGSGAGMGFIAKGVPAKGVAAAAGPPLSHALLVRADAGIRTAADLKGRRVGCSASTLGCWLVGELSRRQGWGAEGIHQAPLQAAEARLAALKAGQVDGIVTGVGRAYTLEASREGKALPAFGTHVKPFHAEVIFATDKVREQHPEALRRFLAAWFETIHFMRTHKDESVRISRKVTRLAPEVASRVYDEVMPMFSEDGRFDPGAVALLRRSFAEPGQRKNEPVAELYTEALLPGMTTASRGNGAKPH